MELYDLKYSDTTRFSVSDINDYNIKATYDPSSVCDTEFYGYRETTFELTSLEFYDNKTNLWYPYDTTVKFYFAMNNDDDLTLIVQDAIDKQNGEHNE